MTGWLYSGDGEVLDRGKEISRTLGLDLEPEALGPGRGSKVCQQARTAYYDPGLRGLYALSEQYGVDYFVLYRREFDSRDGELPPSWEIRFENGSFIVLSRAQI